MMKTGVFILVVMMTGLPIFADTVTFDDNWGAQGFSILHQSETKLIINFSVSKVAFNDIQINNESMISVCIPGVMVGNDEGAPNLPGMGRFFALPRGAEPSFEIVDFRTKSYQNINIAPREVIQDDNDNSPPTYKKDPAIYLRDRYYPKSPVMISDPTSIRGMDASIIGVTPFQYNPVTKDLLVYTDIKIEISFEGGNGSFGDDRLRSPHFDPILKQHLMNWDTIPVMDYNQAAPRGMDSNSRAREAEYIIIVPNNPMFSVAANRLKKHRDLQGIKTEIYLLSEIGSTKNDIKNFVHNAVKSWSMPPVAVLLMADAGSNPDKQIPVHIHSYTPTDNVYADVYNNDSLPDIAICRMTGRSVNQLANMVSKVLEAELNPPTVPSFYEKPTFAAGWETSRWFVICSEVILGYFQKTKNMRPNREYTGTSGPPSQWSSNQNTWMLVDYFGPNGLGYIKAKPFHLTDWGGNATRINQDFNNGSFFALHRDHGSPDGWYHPSYLVKDLVGLNNTGMYPYVLSINCSTGAFSKSGSSDCFAEAFHKMTAGAVGVTASIGTSYSFVNDTYVFGMVDSMFPDFDPVYGGAVGDHPLMPVFANASGKFYLEASNWPYNTSSKEITYNLFHAHCDAFYSMFSEMPKTLTVSHASSMPLNATSFSVTADVGSFIALTIQDRNEIEIIGTAVSKGGPVDVVITSPLTKPGLVTVTVTKGNHLRYISKVYCPNPGTATQYGSGLMGSGGFTPKLDAAGDLIYGGEISLDVTDGLGKTHGFLYIGLGSANIPILGGNLLVFPVQYTASIQLDGNAGVPGDGAYSLHTNAFVHGASLYLQAFMVDTGSPKNVSMTNGLELIFP